MDSMSEWGSDYRKPELPGDGDKETRLALVRDPTTSAVILRWVHSEVMSERGSCSAWSSPGSRWKNLFEAALAEHLNTPKDVLRQLLNNGNLRVKQSVASNPATEATVLLELSQSSRDYDIQLAGNVSSPTTVLKHLSSSVNAQVRKTVALNPSCPPALLTGFLLDSQSDVRFVASMALTALPGFEGYPLEWIVAAVTDDSE